MQRIIPIAFGGIRTAEAAEAFAVDGLHDVLIGLRFMGLIILCKINQDVAKVARILGKSLRENQCLPVYFNRTLSISVEAYWNNLLCELKMMTEISQSHNTLNS